MLSIERQKPCTACGSVRFKVHPGKGPHAAALYCEACGRFSSWMSKREAEEIKPQDAPMLFDSEECPF
jgi:hypothetical protein